MTEMKYTRDHEWVKIDGDTAIIGITEHAVEALGELVYVELPEIGDEFAKGDAAIVVESSKSASDVYVPVSGEVNEVNEELSDAPETVNASPYEEGWLIKLKVDASKVEDELSEYLDKDEYEKYLKEDA